MFDERARAPYGRARWTLADYRPVPRMRPGIVGHIVVSVRKRISRGKGQVVSVTSLPASLQDDQNARMRRYLVSMGIRTTCFVLAAITISVLHWTVVGWVLVIAAVIIPYFAVVVANTTRPRRSMMLGPVTPHDDGPPQLSPRRPDQEPAHERKPIQP